MGIQYYLKRQMEEKRSQMIQSAQENGFTSNQTVRYSQELDHLMNMYLRLCVKKSDDEDSLRQAFG
ncbi:aspartyl-phosphate phosphatase Spo0E family protein [Litchfieldia alkalitelluris]|uniref:Aspartyl-phosphate phosphatase Spo0E family protein n=2 Tax=Evansella alkalicola TaxID=745819 RepID=A0ABS6JRY5_9BACI|nr:aspartyl-phosphate phosphatase Spo0E family protein [Litchfieldia alkalitelluris]MBU9720826.1 aspartyl-phosphate phosphatase Spo0E family protein [Bacillus alkalicola]